MALTIPVLIKGRPLHDGQSGTVADTTTMTFPRDNRAMAGSEHLVVRLSPSYASSILGSLDYLAQYPYGCTEQTVSCFLPDIAVAQLLRQMGVPNAKLQAEVPKMVQSGLFTLYSYQHDDGGWGWWYNDASSPWMTAYVIYGFDRAQAAGYPVNQDIMHHGVEKLKDLAKNWIAGSTPEDRVFTAYVLAMHGEKELAGQVLDGMTALQQKEALPPLTHWGLAVDALALHASGHDAEAHRVLDGLWADFAAGRLRDVEKNGYEPYSPTDDAAMLLFAATEIDVSDARIEGLVHWLFDHRIEDHWYSTRDTAFTLYGLTRYLQFTHELQPDYQAVVTVNHRQVATKHFTAEDVARPEFSVDIPAAELGSGPLQVTITRNGIGKLYYNVTYERFTDRDLYAPHAVGNDLAITRVYQKYIPSARNGDNTPGSPQTAFAMGDIVQIKLTFQAKRPFDYILIEDPLPAGLEAQDRGTIDYYDWNFWWTNQIIRDNKVAFAIRHLEPGSRTITYQVRTMTPGQYLALPPRIYDMYNPNAWAEGPAQNIRIRE